MGRQITGMQQAWRILRMKPAEVIAYQQEQLHDLIQFARKHSPFYQQLYARLPTDIQKIQQLPPVTKPQLMANFDGWVTDRAITRKTVDAFLADKTLVGQLYLERYMLSTTSGSSGQRGIFIQNPKDELPYRLLNMLQTGMFSPRTLRRRIRWVTISATGDHFGSVSAFTLLKNSRQRSPFFKALFASMSILPVTMPFSELVQALNQERPTVIFGYSSIMAALAEEQLAGHLCARPALVSLGGETISEQAHQRIATAFRCLVRDGYSTAECPFIAVSCPQGWLHVCSERALIEPVDEAYRPVLPGQPSYTVLLTNLINRVQPIIRYDLGDSVTLRPDACPCGNPFPALKVLGRKNDTLRLAAADGSIKAIQPMIFNALIDILPGVRRWQVIQNAPSTLSVRLEASSQAEDAPTWAIISQRLHAYCEQQNLSNVNIERSSDPPQRDQSTGKFYQVRLQTGLTQELSRNTSEHPWPVI
jgi:phenylacetate-coenzyme A ligase PaaK-like adenylate-forming protein